MARWRIVALALATLLWCALNLLWLQQRQWPPEQANAVVTVQGKVVGVPQWRGHQQRFVLAIDAAEARRHDPILPHRIEVSWYRPSDYLYPGEHWRFQLRLTPPHQRHNRGQILSGGHHLAQGIGALGQVMAPGERLGDHHGWRVRASLARTRQRLAEQLQASTVDLDHAALKRALLLADRSAVSSELRGLLQRTGTAHLLAISGLHVGMVAGLVGAWAAWFLAPLAPLGLAWHRRRVGILAGLGAALVYAALAGWTLPTVRAAIMLACFVATWSLRHHLAPGRAWWVALVLVLWVDPMAPWQIGFWLSFLAVAALIWSFAWRTHHSRWPQPWHGLLSLMHAQAVMMVALLPLNLIFFGQWVPVAMIANLIAIPLVGALVLPALLLAGALLWLDWLPLAGLAQWALMVTGWGLQGLLWVLAQLDAWRYGYHAATINRADITLASAVLAMIGAAWLLAPRAWPARPLGLLMWVPALWPLWAAPSLPSAALHLRLLDVGDGQALVIRTPSMLLWVDAGPGDGAGRDRLGRLLTQGDGWGHTPSDHRIIVTQRNRRFSGGLATLRQQWPDAPVYTPHPTEPGEQPCYAGHAFSADGWRFRFLHPSTGLPDLGSNSGCVLDIQGPGGRVLLMSAVDRAVEQRLMLEHVDLNTDVLVLSDGGHRRGNSLEFLQATAPDWALISVPAFDRRDRPHAEVIKHLTRLHIPWLSTAQCGAIDVRFDPIEGIGVETVRASARTGCP